VTFNPSLNDSPAKVTRVPYGGHEHSIDVIGARIREGSVSPRIRSWASKALLAAGIDGRNGVDQTRTRVATILNAFRSQTVYSADPVGRELIQSAEVTLCLDPNLCIPTEDCDGGVVAVGSATTSVGIPTMVVKEDYPDGQQSHVLLACRDESGDWFFADPSTNKPVGVSTSPRGTKRTWINPLEGVPVELIGVGHAPLGRAFTSGEETLGADPPPDPLPGPFAVQIPGNWTPATNNQMVAGLRYALGIVTPDTWTEQDVRNYFNPSLGSVTVITGPSMMLETVQLVPGIYNTLNPWIVTGIARQDAVVQDNPPDVRLSAVLQETPVPAAQQPGPAPTPGGAPKAPPPPQSGISVGSALLVALGVAAIGGVAYGAYEYKKKHGRHLLSNPTSRRRRLKR
jgi:hypothetical protein